MLPKIDFEEEIRNHVGRINSDGRTLVVAQYEDLNKNLEKVRASIRDEENKRPPTTARLRTKHNKLMKLRKTEAKLLGERSAMETKHVEVLRNISGPHFGSMAALGGSLPYIGIQEGGGSDGKPSDTMSLLHTDSGSPATTSGTVASQVSGISDVEDDGEVIPDEPPEVTADGRERIAPLWVQWTPAFGAGNLGYSGIYYEE